MAGKWMADTFPLGKLDPPRDLIPLMVVVQKYKETDYIVLNY